MVILRRVSAFPEVTTLKKITAFCLAAAALIALASCSFEFSRSRNTVQDGVAYYKSATRSVCFAGAAEISEDATELTIPDEVEGCRVIALGGTWGASGTPEPFAIYPKGAEFPVDRDSLPDGANVTEMKIELYLGKNIEEINNSPRGYFPMGDGRYVHLTVNVTCDKDNAYFYSEDGILYESESGEMIDYFEYAKD